MKQFTLALSKGTQRPVIFLKSWHKIFALLDTGAVCPVWTKSEELLQRLGGKFLNQRAPVSGFGGTVYGNVYELPELQVGELTYPGIKIVASFMKDAPYQLILPATMFSRLIYEIDDKNHRLNITIPSDESNIRNLSLKDSNGRFYVLCSSAEQDSEGMKPADSFSITEAPSKINI